MLQRFINHMTYMSDMKNEWFAQLFSDLKESNKLRNLVVHADWESAEDDSGSTPTQIKQDKGRIVQEYYDLTPNSLRKILKQIKHTKKQLEEFEQRYYEPFPG